MSTGILHLHSFLPYIFLVLLVYVFVSSLIGWQQGKNMSARNFKLAKVTFILTHVQLLIGVFLFFVSQKVEAALATGDIMKNAFNREIVIEHPVTMVLGIAMLTLGYLKAKKGDGLMRNKNIALYYGFAFFLFIAMIPWDRWFN